MKHSIDCPYPEGCNCGASHINQLLRKTTSQEQELATLRAKAEAYDKGQEGWAVFDPYGKLKIANRSKHDCLDYAKDLGNGYTCRKVRIVEVVE